MKKITDDDIQMINKLYLQYGTYSGVAEAMNISPATVKKYLFPIYLLDKNETAACMIEEDDWKLDDIDDFASVDEHWGNLI